MTSPYWLTREECLALHDLMVSQYGGSVGLRDEGLLESALARPQQLLAYGNPTMPELATAYAAGIIKNRPFLDGNKRTGFMMGVGFLERNSWDFFADQADAALRTLALAAGAMTDAAYAGWMESNSKPPSA
ncbi:MAG: type II toxin-antitoxin system death-on-curing family toxin [Verrucomicrobiota bacterium]